MTKPFWNEHSKEMYDLMMRLAYQWEDHELAYHVMEKSRAMLLRERLRHLRFVYEYGVKEKDLERLKKDPLFQGDFDAKYPGISKMLSTSIPELDELKSKIANDQALVYYFISQNDSPLYISFWTEVMIKTKIYHTCFLLDRKKNKKMERIPKELWWISYREGHFKKN